METAHSILNTLQTPSSTPIGLLETLDMLAHSATIFQLMWAYLTCPAAMEPLAKSLHSELIQFRPTDIARTHKRVIKPATRLQAST